MLSRENDALKSEIEKLRSSKFRYRRVRLDYYLHTLNRLRYDKAVSQHTSHGSGDFFDSSRGNGQASRHIQTPSGPTRLSIPPQGARNGSDVASTASSPRLGLASPYMRHRFEAPNPVRGPLSSHSSTANSDGGTEWPAVGVWGGEGGGDPLKPRAGGSSQQSRSFAPSERQPFLTPLHRTQQHSQVDNHRHHTHNRSYPSPVENTPNADARPNTGNIPGEKANPYQSRRQPPRDRFDHLHEPTLPASRSVERRWSSASNSENVPAYHESRSRQPPPSKDQSDHKGGYVPFHGGGRTGGYHSGSGERRPLSTSSGRPTTGLAGRGEEWGEDGKLYSITKSD
ncbi:hypothetical protein DFJ73DRAFT_141969 [Zopfochytrium polystomum]|nr:hypothetical protein DFJ73DRAFT_141969 [Zopfochytrium polystomum]